MNKFFMLLVLLSVPVLFVLAQDYTVATCEGAQAWYDLQSSNIGELSRQLDSLLDAETFAEYEAAIEANEALVETILAVEYPACATYAGQQFARGVPLAVEAMQAYVFEDYDSWRDKIYDYNLYLGRTQGYLVALGVELNRE